MGDSELRAMLRRMFVLKRRQHAGSIRGSEYEELCALRKDYVAVQHQLGTFELERIERDVIRRMGAPTDAR